MTADEKRILGVSGTSELANLRDAVVALVAAEKQRVADKEDSDALRAHIHADDERWKNGVEERLSRMQADVKHMANRLERIPSRLEGEATAHALADRTELTAATLVTDEITRRATDKAAVRTFFSRSSRVILSIVACVLLIVLSLAMFAQRMDLVGDAAGVLAAIAAVVAITYGNRQK